MDDKSEEKVVLLKNLLSAVNQCQIAFGYKTELATENDERIQLLCESFDDVFKHGLKQPSPSHQASSIRHLTDVAGLSRLTALLPFVDDKLYESPTNKSYWGVVKTQLSRHELERFGGLRHVNTDVGRCRAWLRSSLNERMLENYLHAIVNMDHLLQQHYEDWSFMLDVEKSITLPNMAAGLSTVLFALNIDKDEFNETCQSTSLLAITANMSSSNLSQPIITTVKRKKKAAKIINFDDDGVSTVTNSSEDSALNPKTFQRPAEICQSNVNPSTSSTNHSTSLILNDTSFTNHSSPSTNQSTPIKRSTNEKPSIRHLHTFIPSVNDRNCSSNLSSNGDTSSKNTSAVYNINDEEHKSNDSSYNDSVYLKTDDINITGNHADDIFRCSKDNIANKCNVDTENIKIHDNDIKKYDNYKNGYERTTKENDCNTNFNSDNINNHAIKNFNDIHEEKSRRVISKTADTAEQHDVLLSPSSLSFISPITLNKDAGNIFLFDDEDDEEDDEDDNVTNSIKKDDANVTSAVPDDDILTGLKLFSGENTTTTKQSQNELLSFKQKFNKQDDSNKLNDNQNANNNNNNISCSKSNNNNYVNNNSCNVTNNSNGHAVNKLSLVPLNKNGLLCNLNMVHVLNGDNASESYGSFDSHDIPYNELLREAYCAIQNEQQPTSSSSLNLSTSSSSSSSHKCQDADEKCPSSKMNVDLLNLAASYRSTIESMNEQMCSLKNDDLKNKYNELLRENSLLKEQMKGYLQAVKFKECASDSDSSKEIKEYEDKLLQIAEMHGELMEFNEKLHKKLLNREKQMRTMHIVIEDLKRKLSSRQISDDISNSLTSQSMNLIIPAAFLQGSSKGPYHIYQIYIKIRNEEWIIYRRYTDFFELHHSLKKYFQIVKQFNFPPKKTFGKMDPKLVEDRRKGLEDYLRKVLFMLHENCPQFANSPCRITLLTVLPFFSQETTHSSVSRLTKKHRFVSPTIRNNLTSNP